MFDTGSLKGKSWFHQVLTERDLCLIIMNEDMIATYDAKQTKARNGGPETDFWPIFGPILIQWHAYF